MLAEKINPFFKEHDVKTVPQLGFSGYSDNKLLKELDRVGVDIFITIDGNIEYQQQFKDRVFGTIVIRAVSNRFSDLEHLEKELLQSVKNISAGLVVHIPL